MWTGKLRLLFVCFFLTGVCPFTAWGGAIPNGFVVLNNIIPDVKVELRYCSNHNFVGERIDGYMAPKCLVTREAAEALKHVQEELRRFGLGLKIYDAYRPQRAVDHFVRWGRDLNDVRMKGEFYPDVDKANLPKTPKPQNPKTPNYENNK